MISQLAADQLLDRLQAESETGPRLRMRAMALLGGLPGYDWCGVYRLDGEVLILDSYVGAPTDHTRIAVGQGVCGTAVADDRNQVVRDVRELANYLACSLETRSEIVVLIRSGAGILGQIDVDGHAVGAFDETDEAFLLRVAAVLAERW